MPRPLGGRGILILFLVYYSHDDLVTTAADTLRRRRAHRDGASLGISALRDLSQNTIVI